MPLHTAVPRTSRRRGIAILCVAALFALAAGAGIFAAFTSSDSASQNVNTGQGIIYLTQPGPYSFSGTIGPLAAGDSASRPLTLNSNNSFKWDAVELQIDGSPRNALITNPDLGLQIEVQSCTTAWIETSSGSHIFQCDGVQRVLVPAEPAINDLADIGPLNVTQGTGTSSDLLLITVAIPYSADNSLQGLTTTVTYTFTAIQRPPVNL